MELRTLENTPLRQITATFNEAFSDYFIPLCFSDEAMAAKCIAEGVVWRYSVGAFEQGSLVGFMLHGYDVVRGKKTVYNAGTGVIPAFRGRGLTARMYRYCIPQLLQEGIGQQVLEVMEQNHPAIAVYEGAGFQKQRMLSTFKGTVAPAAATNVQIKILPALPDGLHTFGEVIPSWQNTVASMKRHPHGHQLLGAFRGSELLGFAAWAPATGRVKQCAVHPRFRRQSVGTALFHHMQQLHGAEPLVVTNVDEGYTPALQFFEALQFQKLLRQWEMTWRRAGA